MGITFSTYLKDLPIGFCFGGHKWRELNGQRSAIDWVISRHSLLAEASGINYAAGMPTVPSGGSEHW